MKKVIVISGLVISIMFFTTQSCNNAQVYEHGYIVKIGDMAPDFLIKELDGSEYMLSDLRGKVVMLQFTASWCSVCRKEMPYIEREIWQEKKDEGLKVIGIDRDEPPETVRKFRNDVGITYPLALDPAAGIFSLYAEKDAGVTRNVIIDREGKIIFLTRLFKMDEFNEMKKIIFSELEK
ncbi:MAG: TlpA disulfide reductase family protein [Bacteroidota bacterium]|nr:TlpA disulfide reductase family protein [Bacteroidota bacterium]